MWGARQASGCVTGGQRIGKARVHTVPFDGASRRLPFMRKASASDRDYFRRVAAANGRLELAKPPASLEEVFEHLEHMEDRLGDLGHARESDPGAATWLRVRPALSDSDTSTRRTALGELARVLDGLSIRWALIRGLAANRYRRAVRYTVDIALLVARPEWGIRDVEAALTAAGWSVRRADADADAALLRANHTAFGPVDLLVACTDYQRGALERARAETVQGVGATPVLAVEDVIVHQLIAGRYQDMADIEAILDGGVVVDASYVERWAEFWDVLDRWRTLTR